MCMYTIPTYIIGIVYIHINYTARLIRMSILMCMYTIYTIYVLNTWVYWCVYALFIDVCIYYIRNTWLYWCVCILYAHVYTDVYIEKPMYVFQNNVCCFKTMQNNVWVLQQCMCFKTMYVFQNNVCVSQQGMCFKTMYVFHNNVCVSQQCMCFSMRVYTETNSMFETTNDVFLHACGPRDALSTYICSIYVSHTASSWVDRYPSSLQADCSPQYPHSKPLKTHDWTLPCSLFVLGGGGPWPMFSLWREHIL